MKILATFPGKYGDSIWAMPTVRALAEVHGPVDLLMSPQYSGICDLYRQQSYIGRAEAWPSWQVQNSAPMTPWSPFEETLHHEALALDPSSYDAILHLGYREWPTAPLPQYVYGLVRQHYPQVEMAPLALDRPWIQVKKTIPCTLAVGFSDEWFELKYGVTELIASKFDAAYMSLAAPNSRWEREAGWRGVTWDEAIPRVAGASCVLACCSSLHVLAVAIGTPLVVMEPNQHRHNPIFYPLGMHGPQVNVVMGGDGLPTFDARHTADTIRDVLNRTREKKDA